MICRPIATVWAFQMVNVVSAIAMLSTAGNRSRIELDRTGHDVPFGREWVRAATIEHRPTRGSRGVERRRRGALHGLILPRSLAARGNRTLLQRVQSTPGGGS